jgi:predicted O-methyltransferase YrrM
LGSDYPGESPAPPVRSRPAASEPDRSDGRAASSEADWAGGRAASSEQDLVTTIRAARRRLAADGPPWARSAGDFARVTLPAADGDVLRDLLVAERPGTVIEIGLAYGSSALAIAEALAEARPGAARHVIIDAYQQQFHHSGWAALTGTGLAGRCSLVEERSQLALPRLLADGFAADAAFVDGSHIFHNVFTDLFYLRELVRPGGLVILDDCDWPSVATAARYFEVNTGWQPEPIAAPTRLRAYRLPSLRTEPDFQSFRPFGPEARS